MHNQPELTVWYGSMPESNGKSNWTAILCRKDAGSPLESMTSGIAIARSEYPGRVKYEADCMRYLIGELDEEPDILDYDSDTKSSEVKTAEDESQPQSPSFPTSGACTATPSPIAVPTKPFAYFCELLDENGNVKHSEFSRLGPNKGDHGFPGWSWRNTSLVLGVGLDSQKSPDPSNWGGTKNHWIYIALAELCGVETDDTNNCLKAARSALDKALATSVDGASYVELPVAFGDGLLSSARKHELWAQAEAGCTSKHTAQQNLIWRIGAFAQLVEREAAAHGQAPAGWLDCDYVKPRALDYPLADYHRAPGDGPLNATWKDKPHRIVYDLIAAVRYYAQHAPTAQPAPAADKTRAYESVLAELVDKITGADSGDILSDALAASKALDERAATAAVAVSGPERIELANRIKKCAEHWAYTERIDHGDQAKVEQGRHAELVDLLAAAYTPLGEARDLTIYGGLHANTKRPMDQAIQHGDAEDAARWREILQHVVAEETVYGPLRYIIRRLPAPGNISKGSIAQQLTQAIDTSLAQKRDKV